MIPYVSSIVFYFIIFSSLITCTNVRNTNLPEISDVVLARGKPILLPQNHTRIRIKNLNGTLYSDSFSQLQEVVEVVISNSQLRKIENGAVCSSSSLRALEIDFVSNYQAPILKKNTFRYCEKLENLTLIFDYDRPSRITDDVFHRLIHLKKLVIKHLNLGHFKKEMFRHLRNLEKLELFNCHIDQIDSNALEDLSSLQELRIVYSDGLIRLPRGLFKKSSKLKRLILTNNNIADLTWDEFEGLSSLKVLVLVQNQILHFDAVKIARHMPNLRELNIELNPLPCRLKEHFINQLKAKFGHSIQVTYKYDPGFFSSCERE